MKEHSPFAAVLLAVLLTTACAGRTLAAGQTSVTYTVVADVFTQGNPGLAVGSAAYQSSLSVGQFSVAGVQSSASFGVHEGHQATTEGFDTDYDGIPDNEDPDDDGDGMNDDSELRPYDTDNDGENNLADADDDGDYLEDTREDDLGTSRVKADSDDDGQTDYEEAEILMTNPIDGDDHLRCTLIVAPNGDIRVEWASEAGVTNYWVQRNHDLTLAAGWTNIAGPIAAAESTNRTSYTDSPPPPAPALYRVHVPYEAP